MSRNLRCAALFAISFALHALTLRGEFVWDDVLFRSDWGRRASSLADVFFPGQGAKQMSVYRPLTQLSFFLDERLWGNASTGWHLTNLLLVAAVAPLCWLVLRRLVKNDAITFAAAILFAVHPAGAEVAAWISARGDALATGFGLASLLVVLAFRDAVGSTSIAARAAAAMLGLAAVLGKETGVVFLVLGPLVLAATHASKPAIIRALGAPILAALLYVTLRGHPPASAAAHFRPRQRSPQCWARAASTRSRPSRPPRTRPSSRTPDIPPGSLPVSWG